MQSPIAEHAFQHPTDNITYYCFCYSATNHHTIVEFTTYVPPFTNRRLTNATLAEKLIIELNVTNISVEGERHFYSFLLVLSEWK